MNALVIDYGMGNLDSVRRAFEECGGSVLVSRNPQDIKATTHIVLPGVGSFAESMRSLREMGWVSAIRHEVLNERIPILGICLGMHLLANKGFEGGETQGLSLIPGNVRKLAPDEPSTRIPHVGWNEVYQSKASPILERIADGTDFYFVHSYHFVPANREHVAATTPYCGAFVSAVMKENICGVQFHPEKSQTSGFQVIRNFLMIY